MYNLRSEGIPHRKDGRHIVYPTPEALEWYYRRRKNGGAETPAENPDRVTMAEAERRKVLADAEKREIEVQQLRGELVARDAFRREMADVLQRLRSIILRHPRLRDYADEILLEIREEMPSLLDDGGLIDEPAEATA